MAMATKRRLKMAKMMMLVTTQSARTSGVRPVNRALGCMREALAALRLQRI